MLRYSIADQIDRLTITLLKHWHVEEDIAALSNRIKSKGDESTEEEHAALAGLFEKSVSLNQYRNKIIESINEFFADMGQREDRTK